MHWDQSEQANNCRYKVIGAFIVQTAEFNQKTSAVADQAMKLATSRGEGVDRFTYSPI